MESMTSREFNHDVSAAKRAAAAAPVVITDRGEPAFVLMSIAEFRRRGETGADLINRLRMDDDIDVDFEKVSIEPRVPEL